MIIRAIFPQQLARLTFQGQKRIATRFVKLQPQTKLHYQKPLQFSILSKQCLKPNTLVYYSSFPNYAVYMQRTVWRWKLKLVDNTLHTHSSNQYWSITPCIACKLCWQLSLFFPKAKMLRAIEIMIQLCKNGLFLCCYFSILNGLIFSTVQTSSFVSFFSLNPLRMLSF